MTKNKAITERQLQRMLKFWQPLLGLQAWRIQAYFVEGNEFKDPSTQAHNKMLYDNLESKIEIQHPDSYVRDPFLYPQDVEETLVHELLHIHFFRPGDYPIPAEAQSYVEQGIANVVRALTDLYRVVPRPA